MHEVIQSTIEAVVGTTSEIERLRGKRLLLTGGTGFIGTWLLETIAGLNEQGGPRCQVFVPTRDRDAFAHKAPHLTSRDDITFLAGDVRTFEPPSSRCDFIIHGAASAGPLVKAERSVEVGETIVEGTRRVLELARRWQVEGMLLLSSGAVYGTQPPDLERVPEEFTGGPHLDVAYSAYAEGKRYAEVLSVAYHQAWQVPVKIARPFAFVAPYQDLNAGFAATDFIRDGLRGKVITIVGTGTNLRSYCGAEDMLRMLWGVLLRGSPGRAYNVGSDEAISILELAHEVVQVLERPVAIEVLQQAAPGQLPARYVPSVERMKTELDVRPNVPLRTALRQAVEWAAATALRT